VKRFVLVASALAMPALSANNAPGATAGGGDYYGSGGFSELTGPPGKASIMTQATIRRPRSGYGIFRKR